MRNSIQKFLNLPFLQQEDTNKNEVLLKLCNENDMMKNEDIKTICLADNNMDDVIFDVNPYLTSFYFVNEKNFTYEKYDEEDDKEDDDKKIPLYMVKDFINRPSDKKNFISKVKFKNSKYVVSIPFNKNSFETIILSNEDDEKLFFITRSMKTSICNKIISMDFYNISSLSYIKERKDIWDDGFLSMFASFEIFGDYENYSNIPFLEKFYKGLGVTDTLTL